MPIAVMTSLPYRWTSNKFLRPLRCASDSIICQTSPLCSRFCGRSRCACLENETLRYLLVGEKKKRRGFLLILMLPKKTYQLKTLIPLKDFLDEMHPAIDENGNYNDNSMDNTGAITIQSHKYPHIPCNDYNGVDSDGRHVHDWTHFKGSDCYWVFAVWMRTPGCALDKWDSTEYCDGTQNCSPAMGHPTKFHWHDNFEGTKWHY